METEYVGRNYRRGGPAAIQAAHRQPARAMKVLVLEKDKVGGQIGQTPSWRTSSRPTAASPARSFAEAMKAQALKMGCQI
jgi:thioredoxin reductase